MTRVVNPSRVENTGESRSRSNDSHALSRAPSNATPSHDSHTPSVSRAPGSGSEESRLRSAERPSTTAPSRSARGRPSGRHSEYHASAHGRDTSSDNPNHPPIGYVAPNDGRVFRGQYGPATGPYGDIWIHEIDEIWSHHDHASTSQGGPPPILISSRRIQPVFGVPPPLLLPFSALHPLRRMTSGDALDVFIRDRQGTHPRQTRGDHIDAFEEWSHHETRREDEEENRLRRANDGASRHGSRREGGHCH